MARVGGLMYVIYYGSPVKKDIKKLDHRVQKILKFQLVLVKNNPFDSEILRGKFRIYRKVDFSCKGKSFRIIYQIYKNKKTIMLIMIGSRENFYKRLNKRIK